MDQSPRPTNSAEDHYGVFVLARLDGQALPTDGRYFVLNYAHDPLARRALWSYMQAAKAAGSTALADDLRIELTRTEYRATGESPSGLAVANRPPALEEHLRATEIALYYFLKDSTGMPAPYRAQLDEIYSAIAIAAQVPERPLPPPRQAEWEAQVDAMIALHQILGGSLDSPIDETDVIQRAIDRIKADRAYSAALEQKCRSRLDRGDAYRVAETELHATLVARGAIGPDADPTRVLLVADRLLADTAEVRDDS